MEPRIRLAFVAMGCVLTTGLLACGGGPTGIEDRSDVADHADVAGPPAKSTTMAFKVEPPSGGTPETVVASDVGAARVIPVWIPDVPRVAPRTVRSPEPCMCPLDTVELGAQVLPAAGE
jgi:hypothetical protein